MKKFKHYLILKIRNTKRRIKYSVFSVLKSLIRIKEKEIKFNEINNILLINLLYIGDNVVTYPAIKAIREKFSNSNIYILVRKDIKELVANNKNINKIIIFEGIKQLLRYRKKFELAIIFSIDFYSIFLAYLLGVKYRIGYNFLNQGFLLTNKLTPPHHTGIGIKEYKKDKEIIHQVDMWLNLVRLVRATTNDKFPKIEVNQQQEKEIDAILKNYNIEKDIVGIHPAAREKHYRWCEEKFAQLANLLICRYKVKILITGSKKDIDVCNKIENNIRNSCINLAGKIELELLPALLKKVKLLISVDTGIPHIAAAVGIRGIVLFGPGAPLTWCPYSKDFYFIQKQDECFGCRLPKCTQKEVLCMNRIEVDDIIQLISNKKLLRE